MMPSPPIDDRPDTRYSCSLAAGTAKARIGALDSPAVAHPILSLYKQTARSPLRAHSCLAANRSRQPLKSNLRTHAPAAKSP